jgi:hypothetical protein
MVSFATLRYYSARFDGCTFAHYDARRKQGEILRLITDEVVFNVDCMVVGFTTTYAISAYHH